MNTRCLPRIKDDNNMKYLTKIEQLEHLSPAEKAELKQVTDKFAFRTNDYYLSLIDWKDHELRTSVFTFRTLCFTK